VTAQAAGLSREGTGSRGCPVAAQTTDSSYEAHKVP